MPLSNDKNETTNDELRDYIMNLRTDISRVKTLLDGGDRPEHGIIVKVDRLVQAQLEQDEQTRQKRNDSILMKTTLIGSIIALVVAVVDFFKK